MKLSSQQKTITILSYIALLLTSAIHLADAALNLVYGRYRSDSTNNQYFYQRLLPTTAFTFITGLLMLIYVLVSVFSLVKKKEQRAMAVLSWYLCFVVTGFNFSVGVVTANQYMLYEQVLEYYQISLKGLDARFIAFFRMILADAIVSFVLGLTACLWLLRWQSYRRALMGVVEERQKQVQMVREEHRIEQVINVQAELDMEQDSI